MSYAPFQLARIANGLCVQCGVAKVHNRKVCTACSAVASARDKARRAKRKAASSCSRCEAARIPGKTMCAVHAKEAAKYHKKRLKRMGLTNAELSAKWRREHPGYHNRKQKEYRKRHPDRIKAINCAQLERIHKNPAVKQRWKGTRRRYYVSHKEQARKSNREYQKRNSAKRRAWYRAYYKRNRESILSNIRPTRAKWREAHRERLNESNRRHYHANPLAHRAKSVRRRALKAKAPGRHSVAQWLARVEYHSWRCRWCGRKLTLTTLTQDHVIALSKGGSNWPSNLVPACSRCNPGKGAKRHYTPPAA